MAYYHCSPTSGLTVLQPRKPESFDKPARVYMTTLLPMALMYGVRNYEYTYGYTKEGQIYLDEYFPNALEELYRGKPASLYLCDPESVETTRIPNEAVSDKAGSGRNRHSGCVRSVTETAAAWCIGDSPLRGTVHENAGLDSPCRSGHDPGKESAASQRSYVRVLQASLPGKLGDGRGG